MFGCEACGVYCGSFASFLGFRVLAHCFVDILSVRLCGSTIGPYTSKLKKLAAFCSRQGYVSFPASEHTVYEYLAFWSLEGAVKPQLLPSYIAVSEYVTHPWDLGINANSVAGVRPMFQLC